MKYPLGNKLYFSISEVAEITDLQPYILRAWEKEFACLRPRRLRGKNRAYRQRDINLILLIKRLLYEERFTVQGVRQKLKSDTELIREAVGNPDMASPETGDVEESEAGAITANPSLGNGSEPVSLPAPVAVSGLRAGEGLSAEGQQVLEEVKRQLREILQLLS